MASNVSSNPFATVGASWMDELQDGNDGGKMVLETSEKPSSAALHNHVRVNSAPTKLVTSKGKKANWGEILGGGSRRTTNANMFHQKTTCICNSASIGYEYEWVEYPLPKLTIA